MRRLGLLTARYVDHRLGGKSEQLSDELSLTDRVLFG
jgi:hypothetical protein